jgi:hypothetical protein
MAVDWKRSVIASQVSCHRDFLMNKPPQARTVMGLFACAPHPEGAAFVLSRLLQQGTNPTEVVQVLVVAAVLHRPGIFGTERADTQA